MAIIYSYPYVSTVNNSDTLVISVSDTTADNGFLTKSLTADNLASYVTARVNLNFLGDTGTGVVNLDTQNLTISGTANEIETAASSQTLQIGLPDNVTITNNLTVGNNSTIGGTLNVTGQTTLSSVNVTDLTSGRVVLVGTSGELQDSSDLTFSGNSLTIGGNLTIGGDFTGDRGTFTGDLNVGTDLTVGGVTQTNSIEVDTTAFIGGVLTMEDNINMTQNGRIINLEDPQQAQDAATKQYVDTVFSGGLSFRGSFRADSGLILSGANAGAYLYNCPGGAGTRVSVLTGDYYIVANTGGQFYCSGDLLNVGDSIIAVADAAADSSTINDWATLESDNIEGTGLANTVPLWTDSQVLGNSMLSQDAGATKVTISGALDLSSSLINNVLDPVTAQDAATKAYVDASGVNGTGTTNTLPLWSDGPNGVLGDSAIKQHDGNNITIGASVGTAAGANYTLSVGNSNNVSSGTARALTVGANNATTGTSVDLAVIGNNNSASSSYSLTVGQNNQTNSGSSFVAGIGNSTSSNAGRQFVMGRANTVDSIDTIVLGDTNTITETGTGFGSMMVFGHLNNVLGDRVLCLGTSNTATSNNQSAFIIGNGSSSTGDRTYSVGVQNAITGNESYAFGKSNTIAAASSVAVGANNSIPTSEKSYAFGFGNNNINTRSFAIGENNDVLSAQRTYLIGRENEPATDNTIILGQFSDPTVLRTNNTQGRSTVAFAVGSNNTTRRTAWEFRGRATSTGGTGAGDSMRIMAWALLYSTSYADDTAAAAGGVEVGQLYRTGSTVKIRMT